MSKFAAVRKNYMKREENLKSSEQQSKEEL